MDPNEITFSVQRDALVPEEMSSLELVARNLIADVIQRLALKGYSQFDYEAPAPWVEVTRLTYQLDGEDVVQVVRPYTPKELAIQYHRQLNRRRWEEDPSLLGRS
jgi:hypothetical protein